MRFKNYKGFDNLSTTKGYVANLEVEEIEDINNYLHDLNGDIVSMAYISTRLHLTTPNCRSTDEVEKYKKYFNKYIGNTPIVIELCMNYNGYISKIKYSVNSKPIWNDTEIMYGSSPRFWAECDLYATLIRE